MTPDEVLGRLSWAASGAIEREQVNAWREEVDVLRHALEGCDGTLFLEFEIPRLGGRIDAALISGPAIFPIEFKCGSHDFAREAVDQVWDYALDLKNFHEASRDAPIFPILVATAAMSPDSSWGAPHEDGVRPPRRATARDLRTAIREALAGVEGPPLDGDAWARAPYKPTPTIIQAARALYKDHGVKAIRRHDAGAKNLRQTAACLLQLAAETQRTRCKAIAFVTSVPGAGKTLVGLDLAVGRRLPGETHAVYLSGNGPLVSVLTEALVRDEYGRLGQTARKGTIRERVKAFIQNVHHFRDEGLKRTWLSPSEHVIIFDEAQRAWTREKTARFMKARRRVPTFDQSEPEALLSYVDRHEDWAFVVCLVGGGQEIHDGVAGISAWLEAIAKHFPPGRSTFLIPSRARITRRAKHSRHSAGRGWPSRAKRPCISRRRCGRSGRRRCRTSSTPCWRWTQTVRGRCWRK